MAHKDDKHSGHHILPIKVYFTIFTALIILTAVTVGVSNLNLKEASIYVAMAIALIKAGLVVSYFMHLKYDAKFNLFVFAGSILFLFFFFFGTLGDMMVRGTVVPMQGEFLILKDQFRYVQADKAHAEEHEDPHAEKPDEIVIEKQETAQEELAMAKGKELFTLHCAICHQKDARLIGPSMSEAVKPYKDDYKKVMAWVRKPAMPAKREGYPPMTPIGPQTLSNEDLETVSKYILKWTGE